MHNRLITDRACRECHVHDRSRHVTPRLVCCSFKQLATPMESVDTSQIGRYGTISLLKRKVPSIVTAFGIDTEQLTFGRDRECGVRLYYPDVDPVHCKIVFEERKVSTLAALDTK